MTGSPFSNVIGKDANESTFQDVISTQTGDTTTENASRPVDGDREPSVGVERAADGTTHVSGEDETASQTDVSGAPADQS